MSGDERYPILGAKPAEAPLPEVLYDFGELAHRFVRVKGTKCQSCNVECKTPVARNRHTGVEELFPVISQAEARLGFTCSACGKFGAVMLDLEGVEPGGGERTVSLPSMPVAHLQTAKRPWVRR